MYRLGVYYIPNTKHGGRNILIELLTNTIISHSPIIGATIIVTGTVITQLYIHRNTLVESDMNGVRKELDVVRSLFYLLKKYEVQASRTEKDPSHQMTQDDLHYLKNYFDQYSYLIPESIHEHYRDFIKRDKYCQIFGPQQFKIELVERNKKITGIVGSTSLMNDDLSKFQQTTQDELSKLEDKYSKMTGKKSWHWWLDISWRSRYHGK